MRAELDGEYPLDVLIVSISETAGSALYGMLDVLAATGSIWQTLLRSGDERQYFRVRIVSPDGRLFTCGNRIPVNPDCAVNADPAAPIVILPELWLGPDETLAVSTRKTPSVYEKACAEAQPVGRRAYSSVLVRQRQWNDGESQVYWPDSND